MSKIIPLSDNGAKPPPPVTPVDNIDYEYDPDEIKEEMKIKNKEFYDNLEDCELGDNEINLKK